MPVAYTVLVMRSGFRQDKTHVFGETRSPESTPFDLRPVAAPSQCNVHMVQHCLCLFWISVTDGGEGGCFRRSSSVAQRSLPGSTDASSFPGPRSILIWRRYHSCHMNNVRPSTWQAWTEGLAEPARLGFDTHDPIVDNSNRQMQLALSSDES